MNNSKAARERLKSAYQNETTLILNFQGSEDEITAAMLLSTKGDVVYSHDFDSLNPEKEQWAINHNEVVQLDSSLITSVLFLTEYVNSAEVVVMYERDKALELLRNAVYKESCKELLPDDSANIRDMVDLLIKMIESKSLCALTEYRLATKDYKSQTPEKVLKRLGHKRKNFTDNVARGCLDAFTILVSGQRAFYSRGFRIFRRVVDVLFYSAIAVWALVFAITYLK